MGTTGNDKVQANLHVCKALISSLHSVFSCEVPNHPLPLEDRIWVDVPFVPNSLVLNVGALLSRWTGHTWKASIHRSLVQISQFQSVKGRNHVVFLGFTEFSHDNCPLFFAMFPVKSWHVIKSNGDTSIRLKEFRAAYSKAYCQIEKFTNAFLLLQGRFLQRPGVFSA